MESLLPASEVDRVLLELLRMLLKAYGGHDRYVNTIMREIAFNGYLLTLSHMKKNPDKFVGASFFNSIPPHG